MSLKSQVQVDMLTAMKAGETIKLGALRMLKAAIMKYEVSGAEKREASDDIVLDLVKKEIKQRHDAEQQYRDGGRPELADKENAEIKILEIYMPPQMSEAEIRAVIEATMTETGLTTKADMGKFMGAIMPKVKGKADGGLVNKMVQEMLK